MLRIVVIVLWLYIFHILVTTGKDFKSKKVILWLSMWKHLDWIRRKDTEIITGKKNRVSTDYLDQVAVSYIIYTETLLRVKEGTISRFIGQEEQSKGDAGI